MIDLPALDNVPHGWHSDCNSNSIVNPRVVLTDTTICRRRLVPHDHPVPKSSPNTDAALQIAPWSASATPCLYNRSMRLALVFACALRLADAQRGNVSLPENQPFPAHRVIGNVYYVGASDLASFLITTPDGHFLINSGFEETVPIIQAGVQKLGFRFQDIKILLTGQAHIDHVGGHALVRKLTGARVLVMTGDDGIVSTGGAGDFQYEKQAHWKACPVDRVLHDNEPISLGGVTLVAHHTPGHTKGCTTFTLVADDHGKPYHVVIIGSANANDGYRLVNNAKYPNIAEDFALFTRRYPSFAFAL